MVQTASVAGYYSFVVEASQGVVITDPLLILEKGKNVFSAIVPNLDNLKKTFEDEGVVIVQVYRLDEHEPVPPVATFDDLPQLTTGVEDPCGNHQGSDSEAQEKL